MNTPNPIKSDLKPAAARGFPAWRQMVVFAFIAVALSLTLLSKPSWGHAVYIFAWGEGDQICSDSYFSKKSPVRQGKVVIYDQQGQELDSLVTDDQGRGCFKRPQASGDFRLVVQAGEGHQAEFNLRAANLPDIVSSAPPTSPETSSDAAAATTITDGTAVNPSLSAGSQPDIEAIREAVRQELASQLGPIIRELSAQAADQTPKFKEIFGGIGWLAGIFGLAFWWSGKKNKNSERTGNSCTSQKE
jgi:nickel transport protein